MEFRLKLKRNSGKAFLIFSGLITGFIIFFAFGEIYLRMRSEYVIKKQQESTITGYDLELLYQMTPGGRRIKKNVDLIIKNHGPLKRDIRITTNSNGFRDKELDDFKSKDEIRILALGDSITLGDYLNREEVYVERLEYYLNNAVKDKHIEVINAGVGSIGLEEEINILTKEGLKTKPDVVMIGFYLNDDAPPGGYPGETGYRNFFRRNSLVINNIYKYFIIRKWIVDNGIDPFKWYSVFENSRWYADRNDFMRMVEAADYDWGRAWKDEFWKKIESQFGQLKQMSSDEKFKVVIVGFPVEFQVMAGFLENTPQIKLAELSRRFGFQHIDLLEMLRSENEKELYFDQVHPNIIANDMIGSYLADFFVKSVL